MEPLYILLEAIFWLVLGMVGLALALMIGITIALIVCGTRVWRSQKKELDAMEKEGEEWKSTK